MVKIPIKVKVFLNRILIKFKPEKIYLFGSRALGKQKKDSDWDFIIISEKFKMLNGYRRAVEIYKLSKGDFAFDVLCFTNKEFEQKKKQPYSIISTLLKQKGLIQLRI